MNQIIEQVTDITIDDIPDLKGGRNTSRMMLSLPEENYHKLQMLKNGQFSNGSKKDVQEFVRMLIDRALKKLAI